MTGGQEMLLISKAVLMILNFHVNFEGGNILKLLYVTSKKLFREQSTAPYLKNAVSYNSRLKVYNPISMLKVWLSRLLKFYAQQFFFDQSDKETPCFNLTLAKFLHRLVISNYSTFAIFSIW